MQSRVRAKRFVDIHGAQAHERNRGIWNPKIYRFANTLRPRNTGRLPPGMTAKRRTTNGFEEDLLWLLKISPHYLLRKGGNSVLQTLEEGDDAVDARNISRGLGQVWKNELGWGVRTLGVGLRVIGPAQTQCNGVGYSNVQHGDGEEIIQLLNYNPFLISQQGGNAGRR